MSKFLVFMPTNSSIPWKGAVVTNNDEVAKKIRLMKNFGFTHYDQTDYIGTNGKMNEVSAAVGLTNLESMDEFITVNYRNYEEYLKELRNFRVLRLFSMTNENGATISMSCWRSIDYRPA